MKIVEALLAIALLGGALLGAVSYVNDEVRRGQADDLRRDALVFQEAVIAYQRQQPYDSISDWHDFNSDENQHFAKIAQYLPDRFTQRTYRDNEVIVDVSTDHDSFRGFGQSPYGAQYRAEVHRDGSRRTLHFITDITGIETAERVAGALAGLDVRIDPSPTEGAHDKTTPYEVDVRIMPSIKQLITSTGAHGQGTHYLRSESGIELTGMLTPLRFSEQSYVPALFSPAGVGYDRECRGAFGMDVIRATGQVMYCSKDTPYGDGKTRWRPVVGRDSMLRPVCYADRELALAPLREPLHTNGELLIYATPISESGDVNVMCYTDPSAYPDGSFKNMGMVYASSTSECTALGMNALASNNRIRQVPVEDVSTASVNSTVLALFDAVLPSGARSGSSSPAQVVVIRDASETIFRCACRSGMEVGYTVAASSPSKVTGITTTRTKGRIETSWRVVPSATKYEAQWKVVADEWNAYYVESASNNYAHITGGEPKGPSIEDDDAYQVRIRAGNAVGWGVWSNPLRVNPTSNKNIRPSPLILLSEEGDHLKVEWRAQPSVPAKGSVRVRYREEGSGSWRYVDANAKPGGQNFVFNARSTQMPGYEGGTLTSDTVYEVQARVGRWSGSVYTNGWGAWSPSAYHHFNPAAPPSRSGPNYHWYSVVSSSDGGVALDIVENPSSSQNPPPYLETSKNHGAFETGNISTATITEGVCLSNDVSIIGYWPGCKDDRFIRTVDASVYVPSDGTDSLAYDYLTCTAPPRECPFGYLYNDGTNRCESRPAKAVRKVPEIPSVSDFLCPDPDKKGAVKACIDDPTPGEKQREFEIRLIDMNEETYSSKCSSTDTSVRKRGDTCSADEFPFSIPAHFRFEANDQETTVTRVAAIREALDAYAGQSPPSAYSKVIRARKGDISTIGSLEGNYSVLSSTSADWSDSGWRKHSEEAEAPPYRSGDTSYKEWSSTSVCPHGYISDPTLKPKNNVTWKAEHGYTDLAHTSDAIEVCVSAGGKSALKALGMTDTSAMSDLIPPSDPYCPNTTEWVLKDADKGYAAFCVLKGGYRVTSNLKVVSPAAPKSCEEGEYPLDDGAYGRWCLKEVTASDAPPEWCKWKKDTHKDEYWLTEDDQRSVFIPGPQLENVPGTTPDSMELTYALEGVGVDLGTYVSVVKSGKKGFDLKAEADSNLDSEEGEITMTLSNEEGTCSKTTKASIRTSDRVKITEYSLKLNTARTVTFDSPLRSANGVTSINVHISFEGTNGYKSGIKCTDPPGDVSQDIKQSPDVTLFAGSDHSICSDGDDCNAHIRINYSATYTDDDGRTHSISLYGGPSSFEVEDPDDLTLEFGKSEHYVGWDGTVSSTLFWRQHGRGNAPTFAEYSPTLTLRWENFDSLTAEQKAALPECELNNTTGVLTCTGSKARNEHLWSGNNEYRKDARDLEVVDGYRTCKDRGFNIGEPSTLVQWDHQIRGQ